MALYHGTSAASALKIIQSGTIRPSEDGFFYCFDSNKAESMAGALCFATGDGPRNGTIRETDFFSHYAKTNPDFPTGLKGVFVKAVLKKIASAWAKDQMKSATSPLDHHAAILVFTDHAESIHVRRENIVNEVKIPPTALDTMNLQTVFIDDTLLKLPEIQTLQKQGVHFEPISQWVKNTLKPHAPKP